MLSVPVHSDVSATGCNIINSSACYIPVYFRIRTQRRHSRKLSPTQRSVYCISQVPMTTRVVRAVYVCSRSATIVYYAPVQTNVQQDFGAMREQSRFALNTTFAEQWTRLNTVVVARATVILLNGRQT